MKTGDTVWIRPSGDPRGAIAARVDLLSSNGRSIALRLRDRPVWLDIMAGVLLHKEDGHIEMLLLRDAAAGKAARPWVDTVTNRTYDISEVKP